MLKVELRKAGNFIATDSEELAMHHPDEIDVRILKEFGSQSSPQWNVRESHAKVVKRVGVDEETVRKMILRMRQMGSQEGVGTGFCDDLDALIP